MSGAPEDNVWVESPDRADRVRAWLSARGIQFREDLPAGCGGAVYTLFYFDETIDVAATRQAWEVEHSARLDETS